MAKRCSTKNPCRYPRADWWQKSMGTDWYNRGTSAPVVPDYSIYPSTDRAILAGTDPVTDYLSFPGLDIASNNMMGFAYVQQSGHNNSPDGSIKIIRSNATNDFAAITWSNPSTVRLTDGINKYTNASCTFTHTGRTIVFYTGFAGTSFHLYYKYSDDFLSASDASTATWSSQLEMTTDYPVPTALILGQGRAFEYLGVLYKPCHASIDGSSNYEGPLYTSTNDGLTWTKKSLMYPSSTNQYEEGCVDVMPDGTFLGTLRSGNNQTCSIIRSTDLGSTWTTPVVIFSSIGKNDLAINPNTNTVVVFGRHPTLGTTIFSWSKNGGTGPWTTGPLDGRTGAYMYGDFVWHPGIGAFIGIYCKEAYLGVGFAGPNVAIMKLVKESSTPITPPEIYIPTYQDILDFASGNSGGVINLPSEALRDYHSDFINGIIADGYYAELDFLQIYMNNDSTLGNFSLVDWRRPWRISTAPVSPTYGALGWAGNASTMRLSTGFIPSQAVKYTQNDASAFYYCATNIAQDASFDFGAGDGSFSTRTNSIACYARAAVDNNLYFSINDNALDGVLNSNAIGFYELQRRSSTDKRVFKNGTSLGAFSRASAGKTSQTVALLCERYSASFNFFSQRTIGFLAFGSSMTGSEAGFYNRFNTFKTAIQL